MTAPWQRGFPMERLRALARPFRDRHKALVHGAFGLIKERDIAEHLARDRCAWSAGDQAVALLHRLKRDSHQTDFTGRELTLPSGALVATAFVAMNKPDGLKVLDHLKRCAYGPLFVEIFAEDQLAVDVMDAGQMSYAFTKISAGSEVKAVYCSPAQDGCRALPPEELATLEILAPDWLSAAELAAIEAELAGFGDRWAQHYSGYNKRKSWTAFALRGFDPDPAFIIKPAEMSRGWKEDNPKRLAAKPIWTEAAPAFPRTLELIRRLSCEFERVRFMRLRAKDGELSRHADITDRDAGVQDGKITRLHIPIRTSPAVTFHGWDARGCQIKRHFPAGALCYLDQRKPHRVTNEDPELDRIHLVLDCLGCEPIRGLIRAGKPTRASGFDPRRWLDQDAVIERHGQIDVVRDDLLEGGSKLRFLPFITQGADEIVFGGPFCGGAPLALSVLGKHSGQRITLFFAKRAQRHPRQLMEEANGASIHEVSPGYMTNVQAKARAYAERAGALFLPLGFDVPAATGPFLEAMDRVRKRIGEPAQVWCAAGSGMLARCLAVAFPSSEICAVAVGLKSRHGHQPFGANVRLIDYPMDFAWETKSQAPFPSCPNYDRKAWEICAREASGSALFWNVLG